MWHSTSRDDRAFLPTAPALFRAGDKGFPPVGSRKTHLHRSGSRFLAI